MVSYKKLENVYLPDSLYQALIAYQKQQGFEETSLAVVEILTQFLEKNAEVKRYATVEQLEVLKRNVTHLSQQVAQLSQFIASSAQVEAVSTMPTNGSNEYNFGTTDLEDEEDEPDEILYDFIEPGSTSSPSR
jgi:hypothetical protein